MKRVLIVRHKSDSKQTLGILITEYGVELWSCKTLELAWKDNMPTASCIPEGIFKCKWTRSPRLSRLKEMDVFTYEIFGVPGRAGTRFHPANYYNESLGCIFLGSAHKDINADGELDVIHSGDTLKEFEGIMNHEDFELEIVSI